MYYLCIQKSKDSPRINLNPKVMTHFYELYKRVPRPRRKQLARFIHKLKCLCGREYHVHVEELLHESENDELSINTTKLSIEQENELEEKIFDLADDFSIPRINVRYDMEPEYTDERGFYIRLYTDF